MLYNTCIMENTTPTQSTPIILHNVNHAQVDWLEQKFAYLTEKGWVIPEWINLLRKTAKH